MPAVRTECVASLCQLMKIRVSSAGSGISPLCGPTCKGYGSCELAFLAEKPTSIRSWRVIGLPKLACSCKNVAERDGYCDHKCSQWAQKNISRPALVTAHVRTIRAEPHSGQSGGGTRHGVDLTFVAFTRSKVDTFVRVFMNEDASTNEIRGKAAKGVPLPVVDFSSTYRCSKYDTPLEYARD